MQCLLLPLQKKHVFAIAKEGDSRRRLSSLSSLRRLSSLSSLRRLSSLSSRKKALK